MDLELDRCHLTGRVASSREATLRSAVHIDNHSISCLAVSEGRKRSLEPKPAARGHRTLLLGSPIPPRQPYVVPVCPLFFIFGVFVLIEGTRAGTEGRKPSRVGDALPLSALGVRPLLGQARAEGATGNFLSIGSPQPRRPCPDMTSEAWKGEGARLLLLQELMRATAAPA